MYIENIDKCFVRNSVYPCKNEFDVPSMYLYKYKYIMNDVCPGACANFTTFFSAE